MCHTHFVNNSYKIPLCYKPVHDLFKYCHCYSNEGLEAFSKFLWSQVNLRWPHQVTCVNSLDILFLGGLNLHLNHLIAWCAGISFQQFGTLPFGIFLSNLDSRHLMTSPRTLLGQFWHMSIFGDSRAVQVICQKKMPSQSQFFLDEGVTGLQSVSGFVGGQVSRLYGGTIFWGVQHT